MAENEDHRQKNIQLAKKLNEVKENLRKYREENITLKKKYQSSKIQVTKLQNEKEILNSFFQYKHQLDKKFVQHSTGYIQLSQQIDQVLSKCGPKSTVDANGLNKTTMIGDIHSKVELFSRARQLNINDHNKVPANSNLPIMTDSGPQYAEFTSTSNALAETGEVTLRHKSKAKPKRRSLRRNILNKSVRPKSKKPSSKGDKVKSKSSSSEDSKENVSSALSTTSVLRSGRNIKK